MRNHTARWSLGRSVLLALLIGSTASAEVTRFEKGSLIIPMTGSFQTPCGQTSAYGLIWFLLKENGPGGAFDGNPVNIYWTINDTKASPNRCVPTNLHTAPSPSTDPRWNDGCDFSVKNTTQQPVVMVAAASWPSNGIYPNSPVVNYSTTVGSYSPRFPAVTLGSSSANPGGWTDIQYGGAPFIIAAADAERVVKAMSSKASTFSTFYNNCTCLGIGLAGAVCHKVNIHQATNSFDAPVYRRFNRIPPKIALIGAQYKSILVSYLKNAGLNNSAPDGGSSEIFDTLNLMTDFISTLSDPKGLLNRKDAAGMPLYKALWAPHWEILKDSTTTLTDAGVQNSCNEISGSLIAGAVVGSGLQSSTADSAGTAGYSACVTYFAGGGTNRDAAALAAQTAALAAIPNGTAPSGLPLNSTYRDYIGNSIFVALAHPDYKNALHNISAFVDQPDHSIFAECASIASLEGAYNSIVPTSFGPSAFVSSSGTPIFSRDTQFQYGRGLVVNYLSGGNSGATNYFMGPNCTDPNANPGYCVVFAYPGDPSMQIGDNAFKPMDGHTGHYKPVHNPDGGVPEYETKPGVKRLIYTANGYTPNNPYLMVPPYDPNLWGGWELLTTVRKDNSPRKGTITYLAGHTMADQAGGSRMVLNTLMNLGTDPVYEDRAFAAPTAFDDVNGKDADGTRALLFTTTYKVVSGATEPSERIFSPALGSLWRFPYYPGDLREHTILGGPAELQLQNGQNDLNAALRWSASDKMPAPKQRNLFTYVGGFINSNASDAPHGVLQTGWKPVAIRPGEIQTPSFSSISGCVDVVKYGMVKENNVEKLGFVPGDDGICDLQQLLQRTPALTTDSSGTLNASDQQRLRDEAPVSAQLVSMVRGFCFAHKDGSPELEPVEADCDDIAQQNNRSRLGGFVRSTAAVVPSSKYINDKGVPRPTVAYAAGRDGQLHAIYVSGGKGYQGPAEDLSFRNPTAAETFNTPTLADVFSQGTNLPAAGTELWSFMPSTMLPFVASNEARLDSSPAVADVFIDPTGKGLREWHTVLVQSAGDTAREVFALDITNPLKPVLLWDLVGSTYQIGTFPTYASVSGLADSNEGKKFSWKWTEGDAGYVLPPADTEHSGLYDYRDLGGSLGLGIGQVRAGFAPISVVYVASNAGQTDVKGLEVFAIDIATGQKLWQWERHYTSAGNSPPAPASLRMINGELSSIYVGDLEGRVWELNALTGANKNIASTGCTSDCTLAAFDTRDINQPITSNIAIGIVPSEASGVFERFRNEHVAVFGTSGLDSVPLSVTGVIHFPLLEASRVKPFLYGGFKLDGEPWSSSDALTDSQLTGVLQEPDPQKLDPDYRVVGTIVIADDKAYVPAISGAVGDLMALDVKRSGKTYRVNLSTNSKSSMLSFSLANFGGVTTYSRDGSDPIVLGATVSKIAVEGKGGGGAGGGAGKSGDPARAPSTLNWMRGFLGH